MGRFLEKIQRFLFWGWTMRNSYDWDYGFVEQVLLLKLKRLKHEMDTASYHRNLEDLYNDLPNETGFDRDNTLQCIKAHRALNLAICLLERQTANLYYYDLVGIDRFNLAYTSPSNTKLRTMFNLPAKEDRILLTDEEYSGKLKELLHREYEIETRDAIWAYSLIAKYKRGMWT